MMGGPEPILKKGKDLYEQGRYLEAVEIVNKLVQAEPQNESAKQLLADNFEQIGYQQESSSVRNSFLSGAYELRSRIPDGVPPSASGPDLMKALTTEMFFDALAIRMDSTLVDDIEFVANIRHRDTGEEFILELSNATLTTQSGFQAPSADLTLDITRSALEDVMMGSTTFTEQIASGVATVGGDATGLVRMFDALVDFDVSFEMLPGTAAKTVT
jgi:linear primary-alkylsulfatase